MKIFVVAACLIAGLFFANLAAAESLISVAHEGIRFSESVYPHDGGLFISNYGSEKMRPRDDENAGYIIFRKDGTDKKIAAGLHKPTGMAVKDNFLFVCDKTVLKVFNLQNLSAAPTIVEFAADDKIINALARDDDTLYISVTDSGKIYALDIKNPARLGKPKLWLKITGANGMAVAGGEMFIATIPPDFANVTAENVIYRVKDLSNPVPEKFFDVPGLYDGATLSDDGKILYVSDWLTGTVTAIDIATKNFRVIYQEDGIGPADIAQSGGRLFIPELVGSRIIEIKIGDFK